VISAEVDYRRRSVDEQLQAAGLDRASWLAAEGKTDEEVTAELEEAARKAVKAQFVLEALAEKEQLGVSESELTDQVVRRAQRTGMAADAYARTLVESGGLGSVWSEVQRGKALALVLEQAVVSDEQGNRVDLESLRNEAFPAGAQPATEQASEAVAAVSEEG
jgi:trigger factor